MKKKTSRAIIACLVIPFIAEVLFLLIAGAIWNSGREKAKDDGPYEEPIEIEDIVALDYEDALDPEKNVDYAAEETPIQHLEVIDATGRKGNATPHRKMVVRDLENPIRLHLNSSTFMNYDGTLEADTIVVISPHGVSLF